VPVGSVHAGVGEQDVEGDGEQGGRRVLARECSYEGVSGESGGSDAGGEWLQ
jgi:hypothetical protein